MNTGRFNFGTRSANEIAGLYESSSAARAAAAVVQSEGHLSAQQVEIVEPFDPHYTRNARPRPADLSDARVRARFTAGAAGFVAGCLVFSALRSAGLIDAATTPGMGAVVIVSMSTLFGLLLGGFFATPTDDDTLSAPVREAIGAGRWAVVARPLSPAQAQLALHALYRTSHHVLRSF